MKILFVDHQFHTKTKSSNFFLKILSDAFGSVDVEYVDVDKGHYVRALDGARQHDIVVLWQLDFLAPAFLAAGYRTVVVPMYDGSANMPYEHWLAMADASFVNFSRTLHERVSAISARSFLVRHYLAPCKESDFPDFNELRAVFWMRRPEDRLTPAFVEHLIGSELASLHVHNAPDSGAPLSGLRSSEQGTRSVALTESRWKHDSNDYLKALNHSNVFIAPRLSEGIGLTMLEALSRGLLVLAHDDAVHNEYISNWSNGILFSRESAPFHIGRHTAKEMAYLGWQGARLGHEEWLDSIPSLIRFVRDTPAPAGDREPFSKAELVGYWDSYLLGTEAYQRYLRNNVLDLRSESLLRRVAAPVKAMLHSSGAVFSLDDGTAYFGDSPNTPSNKFGFGESDAMSAHIDSLSVGFDCLCPQFDGVSEEETLLIHCCLEQDAETDWMALMYVNGRLTSRAALPRRAGNFVLEVAFVRFNDVLSFGITFIEARCDSVNKSMLCEPPSVRFFACNLKSSFVPDSVVPVAFGE